jgi:hypothetical protein
MVLFSGTDISPDTMAGRLSRAVDGRTFRNRIGEPTGAARATADGTA